MNNVRPANKDDAAQCAEWMAANDQNDASLGSLVGAHVTAIDNDKGTVLYVPAKLVLMLDSLAINPDASQYAICRSLDAFLATLPGGVDVYYLSRGGQQLDKHAKRRGFKELPFKVMVHESSN